MSKGIIQDLFKEKSCTSSDPEKIFRFLGQYGIHNLAYDGDLGVNPGYIFRGELDFPSSLQSSLEREWFKRNPKKQNGSIKELLLFEKKSIDDFVRDASVIVDLAKQNGHPLEKQPETCVFWWVSFMQHYREWTRLLDFTRDVRLALYFALEQYCNHKEQNGTQGRLDPLIYCFPCKDL